MYFKPIQQRKKSDHIVEGIISMIMSDQLKKGDRLPTETKIANQFGVSRLTVREACKELSLLGILTIKQGDGTFITEPQPTTYLKRLLPMMIFSRKKTDDLYDARLTIERSTAALAAQRRTEEELAVLKEILYWTKEAGKGEDYNPDYPAAVFEFHEYIAKISGNEFLYTMYVTINDLLTECIKRTAFSEELRNESFVEHEEIFKCIEKRDTEAAELKMAYHISQKKLFFQKLIEREKITTE